MIGIFERLRGFIELNDSLRAITRGAASVADLAPYGSGLDGDAGRQDFEALASDWNEVRQDFLVDIERQDAQHWRRAA